MASVTKELFKGGTVVYAVVLFLIAVILVRVFVVNKDNG